jgi:hypothetical protein
MHVDDLPLPRLFFLEFQEISVGAGDVVLLQGTVSSHAVEFRVFVSILSHLSLTL